MLVGVFLLENGRVQLDKILFFAVDAALTHDFKVEVVAGTFVSKNDVSQRSHQFLLGREVFLAPFDGNRNSPLYTLCSLADSLHLRNVAALEKVYFWGFEGVACVGRTGRGDGFLGLAI